MNQLLALLNREPIAMPRGQKTIHRIETDADSKPSIPERQASEAEIIARENMRDDEAREDRRECKPLGWDCDRQQWERVRRLWNQKGNA